MVFSQKLSDQYLELRSAADCLLLIEVGVFMQVRNEDARTVAE